MESYISDNSKFIVNGFIRAGITGALDAHYNGDRPDEGTDVVIESGYDDSNETEEEETDNESFMINLISDEEFDGEDRQESDKYNIYEDGNEAVVELESKQESDSEDIAIVDLK